MNFIINKLYSGVVNLTEILMGGIFIYLMSNIKIDLSPVPFTMQTFAVLFIGLRMSPNKSFLSVVFYLLSGVFLPTFTSSNFGIASLFFAQNSGYLIGFLLSVFVIGKLKNRHFLLSVICGEIAIFVPGVMILSQYIGIENACYYGFGVFIIPEIIKIIILKILYKKEYI